mmetsp:Transcript_16138/g.16271  ORF Transcript_16138/g.16271 Transcript_16138/m.16271 type:complete len:337 (+) Transcript_16138:161-1171(+)|eukprot:CAMPEP_0182430288 /NCGR_PEP_ID=MMETSP1167-20130531/39161_1 /TAXON_ID=2988 /ORGANISM="Mallomonas Sp, Strain CCMP3275" /LENGTH=336 /DNA_ID=CAMNT_0024615215 /DNA_START=110 /DNA_END=1120 /DNA_ORIENTATION=-
MGCVVSKKSVSVKSGTKDPERRKSRASGMNFVHIRITAALQKKKKEMASSTTPITFAKIILRFDRLRGVLKQVVDVFKTLSKGEHGLNLDGLQKSMLMLHGELSRAELMELFNFVDIDESKHISLKEFLVALTVGYVLEVIPALVAAKSVRIPAPKPRNSINTPKKIAGAEEKPEEKPEIKPEPIATPAPAPAPEPAPVEVKEETATKREDPVVPAVEPGTKAVEASSFTSEDHERHSSVNAFIGQSDKIKEMLSLIVMAYLLFDKDGEGVIRKEAVEQQLEEEGHKSGRSTVLEARWREMDWDANGTIDFAEFVFSFTSWVDTMDTMAEDDEEKN